MKYKNLADMFYSKRQNFASHTAYKYKQDGKWIAVTFKEAVDLAEKIAGGFAAMGIKKGDRIAIISGNRIEWALSDYATLFLGGALVPIYPSLTKEQVAYIVNDSQVKILIVEDESQSEKVDAVRDSMSSVEQYFLLDTKGESLRPNWQKFDSLTDKGEEFFIENKNHITNSIQEIKIEDVATVIYTSGTTGEPKGAVLTHKNILSNIESVSQIFEFFPEDVFLSFLPLSHIFERMAGHFLTSYHAALVAYAESIDTVAMNMLEIRPTLMISVPRLYEKMYGRVLEAAESGSSLKQKIFFWSVDIGREYMRRVGAGQSIPMLMQIKRNIAYKLVFSKLKQKVGGNLRYFVSGGAPLAAEIGEFFNAAGLVILEGYGLTETSPAITFNRPESYRFGTVGKPVPGVEVKIAQDGEILSRGDHIMQGYLNKEEETREVIDHDGWFYTGDIGFINEDGYLVITDRKKNLIVTSGGKNIAPQPMENKLVTSKYIEQAVVVGDKRKFCSAVIVPFEEAMVHWAKTQNISFENYEALLKQSQVFDLIQSEIDKHMEEFSTFERVKKFCLISQSFTQEGGELTPSLKVKRNVVELKYAADIDRLYEML
jgi:long-chain acyl-CoA synthetase